MNILVTGANGFIGASLICELCDAGHSVVGAVRDLSKLKNRNPACIYIEVGDINAFTDWVPALENVDVIIHLAAMVHVFKSKAKDAYNQYDKINALGTIRLAEQAVIFNVKRIIFVSSVSVYGKKVNDCIDDETEPNPATPYAISKYKAEQCLMSLSDKIEVVIIRPPIIYGCDAPGNFVRLIKLVDLGFPLPFAAIKNRRSMMSIANMNSLLGKCVAHPRAAGEIFLVSDSYEWSTPKLINYIAKCLSVRTKQFNMPVFMLKLFGLVVRKSNAINSLCDSFVIKSYKARNLLGWIPVQKSEEGINDAVQCYLREK